MFFVFHYSKPSFIVSDFVMKIPITFDLYHTVIKQNVETLISDFHGSFKM